VESISRRKQRWFGCIGLALFTSAGLSSGAADAARPVDGAMTEIRGRPSSTAVASIVAADTAGGGFLQVLACGANPGGYSNLNADHGGQTIATLSFIRFDDSGRACIYNQSATHVIVDIQGYMAPGSFDDVADTRILDTRNPACNSTFALNRESVLTKPTASTGPMSSVAITGEVTNLMSAVATEDCELVGIGWHPTETGGELALAVVDVSKGAAVGHVLPRPSGMALSNDPKQYLGQAALAVTKDGTAIWLRDSKGQLWRVAIAGSPAASRVWTEPSACNGGSSDRCAIALLRLGGSVLSHAISRDGRFYYRIAYAPATDSIALQEFDLVRGSNRFVVGTPEGGGSSRIALSPSGRRACVNGDDIDLATGEVTSLPRLGLFGASNRALCAGWLADDTAIVVEPKSFSAPYPVEWFGEVPGASARASLATATSYSKQPTLLTGPWSSSAAANFTDCAFFCPDPPPFPPVTFVPLLPVPVLP
jgi:hypothetical protein